MLFLLNLFVNNCIILSVINMQELFLEKFWGKPISIYFLFSLLAIGSIPFIPNQQESSIKIILYLIFSGIIFVFYFGYVIYNNRFPCCKRNEIGVLFVLKVASEQQYKEFKFSIENNFKENLKSKTVKIAPIFIKADTLKNYNMKNVTNMAKLLVKTNCYFCIELFIEADSYNNPTEYMTTIHTGVLHPNVSKNSLDFLMKNLSFGSKPIRSIKFNSKEKIATLKIASNYLTTLSEYTIGILLIMCNRIDDAISVLSNLHSNTNNNHILYNMICEALYEASLHKSADDFDKYRDTHDEFYLSEVEKNLSLANTALPNQYGYHLNMGKLMFLKYNNIALAKKHIENCKKINDNDYWKYSEAFLIAYESDNPNVVYGKYRALKNNGYNLIEITSFIESVLKENNGKCILHLALGVLYDINNYPKLASCHFKQFVDNYNGEIQLRKNSLDTIKQKINTSVCIENTKLNLCNDCFSKKSCF